MNKIKDLVKHNLLYIIGGSLGAFLGFLYWYYIGCATGTCPITASPIASIVWGGLMGGLLFSMFRKKDKNE